MAPAGGSGKSLGCGRQRPGVGSDKEEGSMTALVNGLLWFGIFAIPMMIAVILRRLARKYYAPGDPSQEPDYRRWA
jgi:hypothetical protein